MTEIYDEFKLWDLRIEVVGDQDKMVCDHTVGDYFELSGETTHDRYERLDNNGYGSCLQRYMHEKGFYSPAKSVYT